MSTSEQEIKSVAELSEALKGLNTDGRKWWYRGQRNKDWGLIPSIARGAVGDTVDKEIALTKRFKQNAVSILVEKPSNEFEWLFLMQHHRVPTRLLDWSESPLVGLYFAIDEKEPSEDGALWCIDPVKVNHIARINPTLSGDIPSTTDDELLANYLPSKVSAERTSDLYPAAMIGPRNSPRMYAQQGVFTITHRAAMPIESLGVREHVVKLIIPAGSKDDLRAELSTLGISKLTLFPELDSIAELVKEAFGG